MDLVKISPFWFADVGNKILYNSWKQFQECESGLTRLWGTYTLFTWGCRNISVDTFILQIIYINPNVNPVSSSSIRTGDTNVYKFNNVERKTVEVKVCEADIESIRKWLIANNPDTWGLQALLTGSV